MTCYGREVKGVTHLPLKPADKMLYLEEIILEEVTHWLVGGDVPPGVEVKVEHIKPGDENQSG